MSAPQEIEQLRVRLDQLAAELAESRRRLTALEERAGQIAEPNSPARVVTLPAMPAPPVEPGQAPAAASAAQPFPPPVEPPPLPPFEPAQARPVAAPPPAFAAPAPAFEPVEPSGPSPLRIWLERLQLWPPQDDSDTEVRLGAWWATRLGTLFAVIAAVFFGVYLSVGTPAWVKLVELAAVAAGLTGFGWWLERRWPRFGQVLFAGGQALIFFTAFAAYTVPAVKVLDSRVAAVAWQLAAAALIAISAWRRRAQGEATLAVGLGFAAAWFSLAGGLQLFACGAALALGTTAVVWRRWLGWSAPSIVALFGYWGIYVLLVGGLSLTTSPLLPDWIWIYVVAGFALFFWCDDPAGATTPPIRAETVWFQNTNSSAAVLAGWYTAWVGFEAHLGAFYLAAAGVLGLAAWRRASISITDTVGAVLLAKASGALTLAVITWTEGRTTEMALLVQAGVMLAANWRVRSRVLGGAAALVWAVSLGYRVEGLLAGEVSLWSIAALMSVVYAIGSVVWLLEAARAWRRFRGSGSEWLVLGAAWLGTAFALATAWQIQPEIWLAARLVVGAGVLVLLARLWWQPALAVAGGAIMVTAHLALWLGLSGMSDSVAIGQALVVLVPTVAAAWALGRRIDGADEGEAASVARLTWSISALAVVTGGLCAWRLWEPVVVLAAGAALTAALAIAAPTRPRRGWMWLSAWTLVLGAFGYLNSALVDNVTVAVIGALFVWLGVALLQSVPRTAGQLAQESPAGGPQRTAVIVGLVFAVGASVAMQPSLQAGLALAGAFALLACVLLTWTWIGAFRGAAWTLWLGAMVGFVFAPGGATRWIALTVVTAWVPVLGWGGRPALLDRWREDGRAADQLLLVQGWIAVVLAIVGIYATEGAVDRVWWTVGVAILALVLARAAIPSLRHPARVLAGVAWVWAAVLWLAGMTRHWGEPSVASLTTALLLAALPWGLPWSARVRSLGGWATAGLGLLLAMGVAGSQKGALEPLITVLWGGIGLLWFGLGLGWRSRPHRLLGLIGLLLCIPRVFLVDLQSTLHRILAFAALGVVLLWVGFSYHRFRRWITDDPSAPAVEGKG